MADNPDVTVLLQAASGGDAQAAETLLTVVYADLRARAGSMMRREAPNHTLQPTALVHEAWVRLVAQSQVDWQGRSHFFALAARMMRRVLVDHARSRLRGKRGGGRSRLDLESLDGLTPEHDPVLVALDDALETLAALDPKQAELVVLRYFGGLTMEEAAQALGVSKRAAEAEWTLAKAWLRRELERT